MHHLDRLLGQEVSVLLERSGREGILLPKIGLEVAVSVAERVEKRLDEVTHGTGVAAGRRVAVVDARHGEQSLPGGRRHEAGTAGGRDETDADAAALARDLGGHRVGHA